jgi:hypothetical protein
MTTAATRNDTDREPNGTPQTDEREKSTRVYTISDVIVGQREIEEELETLQQDAEKLTERLMRFDWYRRCHAAGFDLDRIIRVHTLFTVEGDFRALDPEDVERLIQRTANDGGCFWSSYGFKFVGKGAVQQRHLTDDERDCVIYFLANLHRLPKLAPDPAPIAAPVPQNDAESLTPQAQALLVLRQILEWSVSAPEHRCLPDELFGRASHALSMIDPFWDTWAARPPLRRRDRPGS